MRYIGLVGGMSSGKDELGKLIINTFEGTAVSLASSEVTRRYIKDQGLGEPTRDLTREVSSYLRQRFGSSYLVKRTVELAEKSGSELLVVNGLYTRHEAEHLIGLNGLIVYLDTPENIRKERAKNRSREGEFEHNFSELDAKDVNGTQTGTDQKLAEVIELAHISVDGTVPLEDIVGREKMVRNILKHTGVVL